MELETKKLKITCPQCGAVITNKVYSILEKITGMEKIEMKNGGLQDITTTFYAGRVVMRRVQKEIATVEATKEILKEVRELIKPELDEKEKQKFEKRIEELEDGTRFLQTDIKEQLAKIVYQPVFSGKAQEKQIAKRLKTISPEDEFNTEKSTKEGEDILAVIKIQNKEIGKIIIESKNIKKWTSYCITQIRGYMERENTQFAIVATTVLPDDSANDKMYSITEDGIWVVKLEYLEMAFRALRDFLIKLAEQKMLSQQKFKKLTKAFELFTDTVNSEGYKQKFSNVVQLSKEIEGMSERLGNYSSTFCKDLDDLAENVRKNVMSIQEINSKIVNSLSKK